MDRAPIIVHPYICASLASPKVPPHRGGNGGPETLLYEMLNTLLPMIDLQHALEQRLAGAMDGENGLVARPELMDDWCVISFHDSSGNMVRCEFLETERSWRRRDAVQEYNDLIDQGVEVMVAVPEGVLGAVDRLLGSYAHPDVQLASLDELGIAVRETVPS